MLNVMYSFFFKADTHNLDQIKMHEFDFFELVLLQELKPFCFTLKLIDHKWAIQKLSKVILNLSIFTPISFLIILNRNHEKI